MHILNADFFLSYKSAFKIRTALNEIKEVYNRENFTEKIIIEDNLF